MKKSMIRKCLATVVAAACVVFLLSAGLKANAVDFSKLCEAALVRCELTIWFIPGALIYCSSGFDYCENYIEPYLKM